MKTTLKNTPLKDLVLIDIDDFEDERGFFIESWHQKDFALAGLDLVFVQEGHSRSHKGVLRGLHFQDMSAPMGKLLRCTAGSIFDVAVDLRVSSPTFGDWFVVELNAQQKTQIYVPVGFAHGFAALSEVAEVQYKMTGFYTPSSEGGIRWNDPEVGVEWPIENPVLSQRDQESQSFSEYRESPSFK